jgi:hypothetical protein
MNRIISVLKNEKYMGPAGMFLGINTAIYLNIKDKYQRDNFITVVSILYGGIVGGSLGVMIPITIPVYAASIPYYFIIKYLDKKKLI